MGLQGSNLHFGFPTKNKRPEDKIVNIFILEDDSSCSGVIEWLRKKGDIVKVVKKLEDLSYYLEYEEQYRKYDKFIMDASLPGATILHIDGTEKKYVGALNGIDYILDNFPNLGIEPLADRVAILTAFAQQTEKYLRSKQVSRTVSIIDKNDNDLKNLLQNFLES